MHALASYLLHSILVRAHSIHQTSATLPGCSYCTSSSSERYSQQSGRPWLSDVAHDGWWQSVAQCVCVCGYVVVEHRKQVANPKNCFTRRPGFTRRHGFMACFAYYYFWTLPPVKASTYIARERKHTPGLAADNRRGRTLCAPCEFFLLLIYSYWDSQPGGSKACVCRIMIHKNILMERNTGKFT